MLILNTLVNHASQNDCKENVSYDPNGNIIGYLRNGDSRPLHHVQWIASCIIITM